MKTIPNMSFAVVFSDRPGPQNVRTLLEICLNTPPLPSPENPSGGFDYATMRARMRVSDAIFNVGDGGEIQMEDADYVTARNAVMSRRWATNHKDITKFAELFGV